MSKTLKFKPNKKYLEAKYAAQSAGLPRPELSGFPADHPALKEPWVKDINKKVTSLREEGLKYLQEVEATGWEPPSSKVCPASPRRFKRAGPSPCIKPPKDFGDVPPTRKQQIQRASQKSASQKFKTIARNNKLEPFIKQSKKSFSFLKIRNTLSKAFGSQLAYKARLAAMRAPGGLFAAATIGIWAKGVVDVFSQESTVQQRFEVSTSLIPVVGCMSKGSADNDDGRNKVLTGLDTGMCIVADIISFIPGGAVVSFIIHAIRSIIEIIESIFVVKGPPELAKTHFDYKLGWEDYFDGISRTVRSEDFKGNLTSRLDAAKLDVIYMASEAAGTVYSGTMEVESNAADGAESGKPDGDGAPESEPQDDDDDVEDDDEDEDDDPDDDIEDEPNPKIQLTPESLQPAICNAYRERREQIFNEIADKYEAHLDEAYKRYDSEFWPEYRKYLGKYLLQVRKQSTMSRVVTRIRDDHIQKAQEKYGRGDKPGLEPGPRTDTLTVQLRELFDEITRFDPCQKVWNPREGVEALPELPGGIHLTPEQIEIEEKEAKWREELGRSTEWEKKLDKESRVWQAVDYEILKIRRSWQPETGVPDPTRNFDRWAKFDEIMKRVNEREAKNTVSGSSTP